MIDSDDARAISVAHPSLTIAIVNWNTGDRLNACLESIASSSTTDFALDEVVVVDNASSDGSISAATEISDIPVRVIRNDRNAGFALACNQAVAGARSDFLLFLNPDMVLEPETLGRSVGFLWDPKHAWVGICGVQMLEENGDVARSCARIPTFGSLLSSSFGLDVVLPGIFCPAQMLEWDHLDSREVGQVIGAYFLVRRDLFERLGGFDTRFFVYYEEVDLAVRAKKLGFSSYYLSDVAAFHEGGGSSKKARSNRTFYFSRSRILYAWKHLPAPQALIVHAAGMFGEPMVRCVNGLLKRDISSVASSLAAASRLWRSTPGMLRTLSRSDA